MAIIISEEDISNARTYMPISHKESFARLAAKLCVEEIRQPRSTKVQPIPNRYRENRQLRHQFVMGVLAQWYLRKQFEQQKMRIPDEKGEAKIVPVNLCMEVDVYDEWAESHVINQLERLKKNKASKLANTVFDILYDLKCVENMLMGAIRDELEMLNDPCVRIMETLEIQAAPEAIKMAMEALENAKADFEGMKKDE